MRARLLLLLAAATLAAVGCGGETSEPDRVTVRLVDGSNELVVRAEVADTADEQIRGLMQRRHLPDDEAMLFVFDGVQPRSFWMKDTPIPLDLVVIRAGRVVQILGLEPCGTEECPVTRTQPADAALEVAAGVPARAGVGVGALVDADGIL